MNFHFVDRIFELIPQKSITGIKNVTRNESLFYWLPNGERVLSPAVVTEALCQLGGWLKIVSSDFSKRPVLLSDELTEYCGYVYAGDQLNLKVDVIDINDEVVVTKGVAKVNDKIVLKGHECRGYMLPLTDFEDPETTKTRFKNIFKPNMNSEKIEKVTHKLNPNAGQATFESLRYVDGIIEYVPQKRVKSFKNVTSCESYFLSHFPRKPCVPGVLLLTFIGETCQYLVRDNLDYPPRQKALVPTYIKNVRFRKFVEPGDMCLLDCELIEGDLSQNDQNIKVKACIFANNQRVMQAEMGFKTMFLQYVRHSGKYHQGE